MGRKRLIVVLDLVGRRAAGLLLCSAIALLVAILSEQLPWREMVPLGFVLVIMLLAARYGMIVSVFGSLAAALIFAYFLYPPLGSFSVASQGERGNLGWMMLSSIALSYLLLPSHARDKKHKF